MVAVNAVALGIAGMLGLGLCAREARAEAARPCPASSEKDPAVNVIENIAGTASDAWAIGSRHADWSFQGHRLVHWDGCDWHETATPLDAAPDDRLVAFWGNSRDLWLAGFTLPPVREGESYRDRCPTRGGRVFRRRGGKWEEIDRAATGARIVYAIWGSGGGDVWMLERPCNTMGQDGATIRRWDGKALVDVPAPEGVRSFAAIWGSGPRDVWVGGEGGAARWNGTAWRTFATEKERIRAIAGTGPSDIWVNGAALRRWDGSRWTEVPRPPGMPATGVYWLGAAPGGHVFATDREGNIYRSEQATLALIGRIRPWTDRQRTSPGVWEAFAGGRDDLSVFVEARPRRPTMRWSKGTWETAPELAGENGEDVVALWADGPTSVWAAISFPVASASRAGEIRRWNGTTWERAATLDQFPKRLWGAGPDDVWLVGLGGASWHWDGKRWTAVSTGVSAHLFSVWGSGSRDVWAGGEAGTVLRWDGAAWQRWSTMIPNHGKVVALGGVGADFVVAAGAAAIARWDGRGWTDASTGEFRLGPAGTADLFGVWGSKRSDVWVVGTGGDIEPHPATNSYTLLPTPLILHGDGATWKRVKIAGGAPLRAITGIAANDVWAVGDRGTVVRWNGKAWSPVLSGTTADLLAVTKAPGGSVWIGGERGTLLRLSP